MSAQTDLFGPAASPAPAISPDMQAMVRTRLHAELDRIKAASLIPWGEDLELVKIENFFRYNKDMLPPAEAAALWAEVDAQLDRLYAALDATSDAPADAQG